MTPKNLPRAPDSTGTYEVTGKTWNTLADMVEQQRLTVAAPLTLAQVPGATLLGANVRGDSLPYPRPIYTSLIVINGSNSIAFDGPRFQAKP